MLSKTLKRLCYPMLILGSLSCLGDEVALRGSSIEVEDGDTLMVSFPDGVNRIQLTGIDAPESSENPKFTVDLKRTGLTYETLMSLGVIATEHLRKLVRDGQVYSLHYDPHKLDKYGRMPGELFTQEGISINQSMVADGYAIAIAPSQERLSPLQQQSEKEKRGLWGLLPKPTRDWAGVVNP